MGKSQKINSYLPDGSTERCTVVGWSYYDPDSGRFYHKGTVKARTDFVYQASTTEDTLTFIVDSNLSTANGLYSKSEDTGLKNLNIELRNGATLTINGGVWKSRGDYQTAAALDVTRTEKMSGWLDFNRYVYDYGNLTLTGSGTLKINVPDGEKVLYGICANNISIQDNVSLDIKTIGNTFTTGGSSGDGVKSAAIFCYGYLNIDTTGTVNIVCQKAPSKPNVNNPNSYNALDWIGERINLTNAQSVTLNVVKKEDTFVLSDRYQPNHYDAFVNKARTDGWTVTETADTASPYIVKLTRQGLYDADLTVGTQPPIGCSSGSFTKAEIQADGNPQSLSIAVKRPEWLMAMSEKITYTSTAAIYGKDGVKLSDNFALSWGGGTPTLRLTLNDEFKPEVGDYYVVTFNITPKLHPNYGGGTLESAAISGSWGLTAVEKQDTAIPSVKLEMPSPLVDGSTARPDVTASAPENYTVRGGTLWQKSGTDATTLTGGETYTRTKFLGANDGYKFTNATVVSLDGPGTVTEKKVSDDGKTLTVTVSSTAMFTVDFRDSNGKTVTAQQCFGKNEELVLPDQYSETPDGKFFAGWKVGDTTYQPGDEVSVTSNLTFTETWKEQPTYGLRVFPSSQVYEVREKELTGEATKRFKLYSTGNSGLGKITVKVDETKTTRWEEYKEYLYLNGAQQNSVTLDSIEDGFFVVLQRPTESYGAPKDFIDATVWLKITSDSEHGSIEKTVQVKVNVTPGPYVVNCMLVQPDTAEGAASPYKLIEGSDEYTVTFVPDSIDPDDVPAGTEVGLVAPKIPGYDFKKWVDFSATAGSGVQFTAESSATTSFVMPKRDIGRYGAGIFAVYEPSTAPAHEHHYSDWAWLNDTHHAQTCSGAIGTCDEPMKLEEHQWSAWTADPADTTKHYKECSVCHHKVYADHEESAQIIDAESTFEATGSWHTECDVCGETMNSGTIAKLVEIDAANLTVAKPVKDVAAAEATTADTAYYVAATEWVAEDDTVLDIANGDKFQPGTVYTVKIYLEAADSNRFTKDTKFTINGQTAAVSPALNDGENTDSIVLTYTFDATEAGTVTPTGEYDFNVLNGKAYNNSTGVQIADNNIKPEEAVKVAAGTVVKVVADNMDSVGLYFDKWMVINGDITLADESSATTTFTMPEKAVKVLAVYERHVTSLSITDMTLKVGTEGMLTANVVPEVYKSEIEWSSSNEDIATVNGFGKVTAKAVGETTITATIYTKFTTDPPEYISATCTVTVEAADTPTNYTVTVQNDGNGTAAATPAAAAAGTEVTLSATPNTGYHFKEWQVLSGGVTVTDNKFTMPANDVTVKAIFGADAPITYTITFHANGGTASADSAQTGENGKLASLPTASRSGYTFDGWYTAETGGTKVTTDTVFDKDTTVYAHWTYKGSTSGGGSSSGSAAYTVTVLDSTNGSVTADRKTAPAGAVVTLTVTADKGCALETLTVLDKSSKEIKLTEKNGKYTFAMPASSVTVEAAFKAEKSGSSFVDVPSGSYYEDAVIWAADKGITGGTDAAHFAPNGICTRAQAVTFLWRAAGSPAPKSAAMPFTDVKAGSYYEQAVLWAVENGITKGTSDTTFSPDLTCTRAQIVTFLWRSQKSPAAGSENPFTDVKSDAYYADAVLWAVKESVTSGTAATTFSPDADCTRAQIVTFIYRALA